MSELYVPAVGAPSAVIVDVDGTVALHVDRSPYDETRVGEDAPNEPVIAVVQAMAKAGHRIIFCSGRHEGCRDATEEWLAKHVGVPYEALHMRPDNDNRPDDVLKREIFDERIRERYAVVCCIDDRDRVVAMYRNGLGLTVLQVAYGDF